MADSEAKRRQHATRSAKKFKKYALEYIEKKEQVPTGFKLKKEFEANKKRIQKVLKCTDKEWNDWKWQLKNRISDADTLSELFSMTESEKDEFRKINHEFRWAFTPYFASLMDPGDENCPVRKQMIPDIRELDKKGIPDFSGEEYLSPVKNLVRWYPDRVAVHVTNICAGFCRHCLRRRKIGEQDQHTPEENLQEIFDYLKANPEIRDVLFTGGDPFLFSVKQLDRLLTELDKIESIEIKRIGSRVPIVLPQRVNKELCSMLEKHHPLYLNIQVNHPKEITEESARALDMLTKAGIQIGNQTVLMKGINDSPTVIKLLCHELLKVRVRPYYLYHCQGTIGIQHFRTPVETGIEIIENMRGYTSGLAIPRYIITPTGYGKTPLAPEYQISAGKKHVLLRNWEGKVYKYENPR